MCTCHRKGVDVRQTNKWKRVANSACNFSTPFFLIWGTPFLEGYRRVKRKTEPLARVRQWYSFKTQPVPTLARFAAGLGMGIEVVSNFELFSALHLKIAPEDILVNGLAKHSWLRQDLPRLNVIFDSIHELKQLASSASRLNWRCGLRVAVSQQVNVETPDQPAQFGIDPEEVGYARDLLAKQGVAVEILHFHLRPNVPTAADYRRALEELSRVAKVFSISPKVVDLGGGLPDRTLGKATTISLDSLMDEYASVIRLCTERFTTVTDVWVENGRYLLGPAAVLVVTVLDIKKRSDIRILICDGGRTNQALPSEWESHSIDLLNEDIAGERVKTIVCGPTCMADDCLYTGMLSRTISIGDRLIYYNAGAYHISWENRFSNGLCKVLWTVDDATTPTLIREAEVLTEWTSKWKS